MASQTQLQKRTTAALMMRTSTTVKTLSRVSTALLIKVLHTLQIYSTFLSKIIIMLIEINENGVSAVQLRMRA